MSDPVLDLINKNSLAFSVSGRDYLIKCLNPDHEDSNPSFRVDKVSGVAHCFSCGFKTNLLLILLNVHLDITIGLIPRHALSKCTVPENVTILLAFFNNSKFYDTS